MDFYSIAIKLHPLQVSDWTVVVAGISIVVGSLLLLIVVFNTFGSLIYKAENKAKKKEQQKVLNELSANQPLPPVDFVAPVVEQGISGEVVAAISAAVYTLEGEGATVKSITAVRKQSPVTGRNPWAQAAVTDNTRPF